MIPGWLYLTIYSNELYGLQNMNEITACFLKATEPDRIMKSEMIREGAPQAISWDWKKG